MAWSWSILFPTIERPETTPMRWTGSGADGQGLDRGREKEREREVVFFGAPDCGRSDYRPWSWRRHGVVLVILFSTIGRPETTPMRGARPERTAATFVGIGRGSGARPVPLFRRAKLKGGGGMSIYSAGEDVVHNGLVHRWRGEGL